MNLKLVTMFLIITSVFTVIQRNSMVFAEITDYRTREQVISDFLDLEATYPELVTHETIGYTVEGRDIFLFKIGNVSGGTVFIDASIHGNEHSTTETLYWVVEWILTSGEEHAQRIRQRNYVLVIPMINADRYGNSRYNAHGVDLNRNYETGWGKFNDTNRGPYPLSEPETQAVHSVFLTYNITWYLNLHTGDKRISPPWAYQSGVPEEAMHKATYDKYHALSQERDVKTLPYRIVGNYAGGTARDEGYAIGSAYTYCVELTGELKPRYQTITNVMVPKLITLTITVCQASEKEQPSEPPPPPEMTAEDWQRFWTWLKQNPPGWARKSWAEPLENQLNYWKSLTGTTEMTVEDWEIFWEWLKQNPPSTIKNTKRWASVLEDKLQEWKSQNL